MVEIKHEGRTYSAARVGDNFTVAVRFAYGAHHLCNVDPRKAWTWLGDHGLPRRKIRKVTGLPAVPQLNGELTINSDQQQIDRHATK